MNSYLHGDMKGARIIYKLDDYQYPSRIGLWDGSSHPAPASDFVKKFVYRWLCEISHRQKGESSPKDMPKWNPWGVIRPAAGVKEEVQKVVLCVDELQATS